MVYQAIFTKAENGWYDVRFPALPGCITCGDCYPDAVHMAKDALRCYLSCMQEDGMPLPPSDRTTKYGISRRHGYQRIRKLRYRPKKLKYIKKAITNGQMD